MVYNTEAVVIRSITYGETHAIVTLLTPLGKVSALARGAKKPQSRLTAGVQVCVHGLYSIHQRTGMGTISQVEVLNSYRGLREQLEAAAYAAYFCELAAGAADDRPNGNQATFNLFVGALQRLNLDIENMTLIARVWEAKVLRLLGASPQWLSCVRCGRALTDAATYSSYSSRDGGLLCHMCSEERPAASLYRVSRVVPRILDAMSRVPWERLGTISLTPSTLAMVEHVLQVQLTEYAGLSLKSLQFLRSLDQGL